MNKEKIIKQLELAIQQVRAGKYVVCTNTYFCKGNTQVIIPGAIVDLNI